MVVIIKHAYKPVTTLDDLTFSFENRLVEPDYSNSNAELVQMEKEKTVALIREGKIDDNSVLAFRGFSGNNVQLARSTFGTYKTYKELVMRGEVPLQSTFDLCSLIIELITADNCLALGYRKGEHLGDRYLPPAGFNDYNNRKERLDTDRGIKSYLERKVAKELSEEVGLRLCDWYDDISFDQAHPIRVTGLGADTRDSFLTVLNLSVLTNLDSRQVDEAWQEAGNKNEHSHLIYLPNTPEEIEMFLTGNYTGYLGTVKNPIVYESGVCTEGPEYLKGRKYSLIENGVAGMLLAVKYHFGEDAFHQAVEAYRSTGKKLFFRSTIGEY